MCHITNKIQDFVHYKGIHADLANETSKWLFIQLDEFCEVLENPSWTCKNSQNPFFYKLVMDHFQLFSLIAITQEATEFKGK